MDEAAPSDWTFEEAETSQVLPDEPWAHQLQPDLLMGFLSDFRSATRERRVEQSVTARSTTPVVAAVVQEPWMDDPYAGCERQVTPEWWIAADGRWYPPELHPEAQPDIQAAPQPEEQVTEPEPLPGNVAVQPEVKAPRLRPYRVAGRFA